MSLRIEAYTENNQLITWFEKPIDYDPTPDDIQQALNQPGAAYVMITPHITPNDLNNMRYMSEKAAPATTAPIQPTNGGTI